MIRRVLEAIIESEIDNIEHALERRGWKKVTTAEDYIETGDELDDTTDYMDTLRHIWEGPWEGMTIEIEEENSASAGPGSAFNHREIISVRVNVDNPLTSGRELPLIKPRHELERKYGELVPETVNGVVRAISRIASELKLKRNRGER